MINQYTYLIICPLIFLSGFVDSIAGGGGLISVPAYLIAGLPPHMALGTNKASSFMGTSVSSYRYFKSGNIHLPSAITASIFALVGSSLGANLSMYIDQRNLKVMMLVVLPAVTVFLLTRKQLGVDNPDNTISKKFIFLSSLIGLFIGFYDGLIGPGTGTFMAICFTMIGFNIKTATGNTKLVNLSSNIAAFITFLLHNQIIWALAIPAGLCGILGNYIGSGLAIKNGAKIIRPLFYIMIILLFIKFGYDLFF